MKWSFSKGETFFSKNIHNHYVKNEIKKKKQSERKNYIRQSTLSELLNMHSSDITVIFFYNNTSSNFEYIKKIINTRLEN